MAEDNEKEEIIETPEATEEEPEMPLAGHLAAVQQTAQERSVADKKEVKSAELPANFPAALAKAISPEEVYHTIKFVEDVPMRMHAEVARTELPLRDILSWKAGSVVKFDKIIGDPIEILIGEQLIARGEVVVVNKRFGVRISEITRPDEKIGGLRQ